jgi:hypothetical protein
MRLGILLVLVMITLAACGGGNGSGGGSTSDTPGGGGSTGTTQNGGGGGGQSEDTITTELDLGQAFAEDPSFRRRVGPVEVRAIARRSGQPQALPIEFRVSNASTSRLEDVSVSITFQVLPGPDPEDPPVPGEDAPPLMMSPRTSQGQCAEEDTTQSRTTVHCELGALEDEGEALINVVSPDWFKLSVDVTVTATE